MPIKTTTPITKGALDALDLQLTNAKHQLDAGDHKQARETIHAAHGSIAALRTSVAEESTAPADLATVPISQMAAVAGEAPVAGAGRSVGSTPAAQRDASSADDARFSAGAAESAPSRGSGAHPRARS